MFRSRLNCDLDTEKDKLIVLSLEIFFTLLTSTWSRVWLAFWSPTHLLPLSWVTSWCLSENIRRCVLFRWIETTLKQILRHSEFCSCVMIHIYLSEIGLWRETGQMQRAFVATFSSHPDHHVSGTLPHDDTTLQFNSAVVRLSSFFFSHHQNHHHHLHDVSFHYSWCLAMIGSVSGWVEMLLLLFPEILVHVFLSCCLKSTSAYFNFTHPLWFSGPLLHSCWEKKYFMMDQTLSGTIW